jgi:hypothetical protein
LSKISIFSSFLWNKYSWGWQMRLPCRPAQTPCRHCASSTTVPALPILPGKRLQWACFFALPENIMHKLNTRAYIFSGNHLVKFLVQIATAFEEHVCVCVIPFVGAL